MIELNKKYLITTDQFFVAPDGNQYKSVFGTVKAIPSDEGALGIRTNRNATNWYVQIGNMLVAGCQIHYCVRTDKVDLSPAVVSDMHEGKIVLSDDYTSRIYDADRDFEA